MTRIIEKNCPVHGDGHVLQFDMLLSSPEADVYSCECGKTVIEHQDAGTGA